MHRIILKTPHIICQLIIVDDISGLYLKVLVTQEMLVTQCISVFAHNSVHAIHSYPQVSSTAWMAITLPGLMPRVLQSLMQPTNKCQMPL